MVCRVRIRRKAAIFPLPLSTLFRIIVPRTYWLFLTQEIGKGINACGMIPALVKRYRISKTLLTIVNISLATGLSCEIDLECMTFA